MLDVRYWISFANGQQPAYYVKTISKMKTLKVALMLFFLALLPSCEKTMEYYYGIPMQPKFFENSDWQRVINVFGVLRPDSSSIPMSFVYMEKTYPTKNATDEDNVLKNSSVLIFETDELGKRDTISLRFYENKDTAHWDFPRFISSDLKPVAGRKYELECKNNGLPTVHSSAIVPHVPELIKNSLTVNSKSVAFSLKADSLTYLYDVYLFSYTDMLSKRFFHKEIETLEVNWALERSGDWQYMAIYAYDKNLATYLSTSTNSFYTFNTYRPAVTTVEGGFGVFGAMNLIYVNLK